MKNLLGGSVINYGPKLPTGTDVPDGSLFFKTISNNSQPLGLYVYGILQDSNALLFGDQTAQGWIEVNTGKINYGGADPTTPIGTDTAICPSKVDITGAGSFVLVPAATSVTFTGTGAPGTSSSAGQDTTVLVNGQILSFPGSLQGVTTSPTPITQNVNITGSNRQVQFSVAAGGSLTFCFTSTNGGSNYTATYAISECDGTIVGYAYQAGDIADLAATVPLTDCDGAIYGYVYPSSGTGHTIPLADCDGVITGYAVNNSIITPAPSPSPTPSPSPSPTPAPSPTPENASATLSVAFATTGASTTIPPGSYYSTSVNATGLLSNTNYTVKILGTTGNGTFNPVTLTGTSSSTGTLSVSHGATNDGSLGYGQNSRYAQVINSSNSVIATTSTKTFTLSN